jgi:hypothetical protein
VTQGGEEGARLTETRCTTVFAQYCGGANDPSSMFSASWSSPVMNAGSRILRCGDVAMWRCAGGRERVV